MKVCETDSLIKAVMVSIFAVGGLGASGVVAAQAFDGPDHKVWTGAICDPSGGSSWNTLSTTASGIKNTSSNSRYVSCSPTVDSNSEWRYADWRGTDTGYVQLSIGVDYSTAAAAAVTCTAQVIGPNNTVIETVSKTVSVDAGEPTAIVQMPRMYLGGGSSRPLGVSCLLPPQVKLTRVRLSEYAITGNS